MNTRDGVTIHLAHDEGRGRPCIRGMRIRVADVLDLFAAGLSAEEVLVELPDLEPADLIACFQYAARRVEHPIR